MKNQNWVDQFLENNQTAAIACALFYTQNSQGDYLYSQFKLKQNTQQNGFSILHHAVTDKDCRSNTFSLARAFVNDLNHNLNPAEFLQNKSLENINFKDICLKNKQPNKNFVDVQNDPYYYDWISFFCGCDYWNSDDNKIQLYFIEIKNESLEQVKNNLKEKYSEFFDIQFVNEKDLKETDEILKLYSKEFQPVEILKKYREETNNPQFKMPKEKQIIQFINKPSGFEKFKQGVPFVHIEGILKGIYRKKYERWLVYNAGKQQYPTDEIYESSNCIIIPGASSSVHDTSKEWTLKFLEEFERFYKKFPKTKVLGLCFGGQLLAQALGGLCEEMEQRKTDKNFYSQGNVKCDLKPSFLQKSIIQKAIKQKPEVFENIKKNNYIVVKQAHGDVITKLPDSKYGEFEVISTSKDGIEFIIDSQERSLGIQGHPEYAHQWHYEAMCVLFQVLYKKDALELAKEMEEEFKSQPEVDTEQLRLICEVFMKTPMD